MAKKLAALLLCLLLLVGCGGDKEESTPPVISTPTVTPAPVELSPAEEALKDLQEKLETVDCLVGVGFMGYAQLPYVEDI